MVSISEVRVEVIRLILLIIKRLHPLTSLTWEG